MKFLFVFLSAWFFISCDFSYIGHVSYNQISLLNKRISIKAALEKYSFSEEQKKKLELVPELKTFAKETLKMDINEKIYSTYVQLDGPYVTYLLRVAYAYELKPYQWGFPVIGTVPYKGFFEKEKAEKAAKAFPPDKYDTLVRGVPAYSTLNWFNDPILSSMLSYSESGFVVTLFHEMAHTVLFFKDNVNFNERFAEFVGRKAAELFYLNREGENSKTAQKLQKQWEDELLFSSFMVKEYNRLDKWYQENRGQITPERKGKRLRDIQDRFISEIQPQLHTGRYDYFPKIKLNNAILLSYRSYNYKMDEFERLYALSGHNMSSFIEHCTRLEEESDPENALKLLVNKMSFKAIEKKSQEQQGNR